MAKYKKYAIFLCSLGLLFLLTGVTYSLFNYTKTGNLNNLGTGRIYFNSLQNGQLSITNAFPMTSSEANNANLDSVSISIVGDTTYAEGEEFEISFVDVDNTLNGKKVPIQYIATYEATTGNTIGTNSNDYWESREDRDSNIYTLKETGAVYEGKQILVGFIKNDENGINGTLTIKAYIDADRAVITDTYSNVVDYYVNTNMTQSQISDCVSYLTSEGINNYLVAGETLASFCEGVGTIEGITFQEALDEMIFNNIQLKYFLTNNMVKSSRQIGTPIESVLGKEVFTTAEWSSLQNNPVSFKIRVESNKGIWASKRIPTIEEMCPGCVYTYADGGLTAIWNTHDDIPSVLSNPEYYTDDYEEVINFTGKNFFIGLKLNTKKQIEKAYVCGFYNSTAPFCLEGLSNGTKYESNIELLQDVGFPSNSCTPYIENEDTIYEYEWTNCEDGVTNAGGDTRGNVYVEENDETCYVYATGIIHCGNA